ncbi:MAG: bifunctional folylpolyglutamate synthase/dihydrofolate synthase [Defluviitaleaceae bacterium]|nr:bifunctional folylpolyglutamate synthase/dihydrofolate synthase [Defluviitaleaceae bacterium]
MSNITYQEGLDYLQNSHAKGSRVGLAGVKTVLSALNNPQDKCLIIHVAGTNGKGSTCAFLQHILMAAGFKIGLFTSPHLQRYNERITINSKPISDANFAGQLMIVAETATNNGLNPMSFFEILTCMAYNYFAESDVDIAIIETGIGGRLDATNAVNNPLLSVITAPGYDHQEILGDTLSQIASEDAGIVKENCPVALYQTSELSVFKSIAMEKRSPLYYIGDNVEISDLDYGLSGTNFSVKTAYFSYQSLNIRLLGEHQLHNAILSLLCIEALRECHKMTITNCAVLQGLAQCQWHGRFQLISSKPYIVLDGAHNEDGARIFKEALIRYFSDRYIVLVVGISHHKDYKKILHHLLSAADAVICTCASFKAMEATTLTDHVQAYIQAQKKHNDQVDIPILTVSDCHEALKIAVEMAGSEGVAAVAGSLYLIGDIYGLGEILNRF